MTVPAFDPKELEVVGKKPGMFGVDFPIFNYPVTKKEASVALFEKRPCWQMHGMDVSSALFCPMVNPDNIARGFIYEARKQELDPSQFGGKDMFGIEWEYIPMVHGSMVRPGDPFLEDMYDWEEKVVWPNPDEWDWEAAAEANKGYFNPDGFNVAWFLNGWYERLISFMDFENAIMAVFDEDQKEYVHAFFDKLSDLYIKILTSILNTSPKSTDFASMMTGAARRRHSSHLRWQRK